jgi:glutamate dehydrogenase
LTAKVLETTEDGQPAPLRIATWEDTDAVGLDRATATLGEICSDDTADLARLSVGLRVVRGLLSNG